MTALSDLIARLAKLQRIMQLPRDPGVSKARLERIAAIKLARFKIEHRKP